MEGGLNHGYYRHGSFSKRMQKKKKLVNWYNNQIGATKIDLDNVFIVWSCKTLQNYKCLASTTVSGDGIYAEYTYNGDKQELYEDIYDKVQNTCHTEE